MKTKLIGVAAASVLLATAAGAQAQTHKTTRSTPSTVADSSTAAQSHLTHGPALPGVCLYSNSRALEDSAVGKAYAARMQQLQAQAAAEIGGQQTALQTEEKALVAKRATLGQQQFAQQAKPLADREQALNQQAELRTRDLRYTAARQQQRIGVALEPLVASAYEAHHCSLLLNGDTVMTANPAMDLTPEVTTALNGKMSTITFDRETAPAQAQ